MICLSRRVAEKGKRRQNLAALHRVVTLEPKAYGHNNFPSRKTSAFACRPDCTNDGDPMQYFIYLCAPCPDRKGQVYQRET